MCLLKDKNLLRACRGGINRRLPPKAYSDIKKQPLIPTIIAIRGMYCRADYF